MNALVLDASVALKWIVPAEGEDLVPESLIVLKRYVDGNINFIVPDIFWAEIFNVLWKGVRRRRWTHELAQNAANDFLRQNFTTIASRGILPDALAIAFAYHQSVYDCIYVAAAVQHRIELITADEGLANALAARLPVKWLGAF